MSETAKGMSEALALIAAERERQVSKEGWTEAHDDEHTDGCLAHAAGGYALADRYRGEVPRHWPFDEENWKPTPDDRVRELVKAGALIVAEIERIRRAEVTP